MDKPYKVIWKFKNDNRYVQYHIYIFVGDLNSHLDPILKKMETLNLFDTFMQLNKQDIKKMVETYGEKWYKYFFNMYHMAFMVSQIRANKTMTKDLVDKFGQEWYDLHIKDHQWNDRKILYSYSTLIRDDRMRKTVKKGRMMGIIEDDGDLDFKLETKKSIQTKLMEKIGEQSRSNYDEKYATTDSDSTESDIMIGGKDEDEDDEEQDLMDQEYQENDEQDDDDEEQEYVEDDEMIEDEREMSDEMKSETVETGETDGDVNDFDKGVDYELLKDEELDMDEIQRLYQDDDVDPDKNPNNTSELIKKALDDDGMFKKNLKKMIEFDQEKDSSMNVDKLKNVYQKYYVKQQYIFGDDTIRSVKDKICQSIKNNKKFGDSAYLIPSRQFLWSEYVYQNNIDKIMLGQKWIRRNELLDIDIEPDNRLYMYEELKDKLNLLKHNIRRYGNKIRFEDDDNNILLDYEGYLTDNEFYMIDIYNELGKGYNPSSEVLKNLQDVYLKIYFHRIRQDDVRNIIDYLNSNGKAEQNRIQQVFDTINNDMIMENEIVHVVENVRREGGYEKIFKENFVTQSVIHVNLRFTGNGNKLDMYRIFNEYKTSPEYPYIQYQTIEGGSVYKYEESEINQYIRDKENVDVLFKWFENAPYGISFKVKISDAEAVKDKFMSIGLNESGRIEYKTQWQESDAATINDIKKTYQYVKNLIKKINSEDSRVRIELPEDEEFKYAFINTIQKFELPDKFTINHNDLSEFSRFFYPYVALVIEPRKRQAKIPKLNDKSKFGTYLRYKKVSKYENHARLEQRIIFFLRNFEFQDSKLASELAKQFNIIEEKALEEIQRTKAKYPNLKKSRKILKKLDNVPKYKPPGIGIDIQGKQRERYKIRISGARNKEQLDRIISFMNILIYLYIETYLYKKKDRQVLKDRLKKLTNIAKRRSKVDDMVDYSKEIKSVKQMTKMDQRRIGFKPERGQNQWTRSCQNSGNDKKRRPQQYNNQTLDQLIKKGYQYNKKTDVFEKKIRTGKGKNAKEEQIKTIRLPEYNDMGVDTGNSIHYACDPEENGDHMYVGFLTRSSNPYGHCMPCCFKKDPNKSNNKTKKEFFNQCLGKPVIGTEEQPIQKSVGDKLYILQDTNKIQEGRFGYLPKYLDRYFNQMLGKNRKIRHHYLEESSTGYFFKYGSKQDEYQFLNALCSTLDLTHNQIIDLMVNALEKDRSDQVFCSLNNGDIKTQFETKEQFIHHIKTSNFLDKDMVSSLISIPGVISDTGLNIIIFNKREIKIKKTFEKERIVEDFYLDCADSESTYTLKDPNYRTIFIIKDMKNYYPIVLVRKTDKNLKMIETEKTFVFEDVDDNPVNHVADFYMKNCSMSFLDNILDTKQSITAKKMDHLLKQMSKDKDMLVRYQVVDVRNKCKYLITNNGTLLPVRPSGSLWNVQIIKGIDRYIPKFDDAIKVLNKIYLDSKKEIPIKPIGVYYDQINGNKLSINSVMTMTKDVVPVETKIMTTDELDQMKFVYENKPLTDEIDQEILKGRSNYKIDTRINSVKEDMFVEESYELFRLELSNYLQKNENVYYRTRLEKIMGSKISKKEMTDKIRLVLYRIIDRKLYEKYLELIDLKNDEDVIHEENEEQKGGMVENVESTKLYANTLAEIFGYLPPNETITLQTGGKINKFVHRISKLPNVVNFQINNDRQVCEVNNNKDRCNNMVHCRWTHGSCYMGLTTDMIVMFVNRVSEELAQNDMKAFEIMRIGNYFVSDIVDRNRYTEIKGQKIIRANSSNIRRILHDLFGRDSIPNIGKRKSLKVTEVNYHELNLDHPPVDLKNILIQQIIDGNISIFRAYSNGYYWLKNKYYDNDTRNLGYYSPLQSDFANNFKSMLISWLSDENNTKLITKDMLTHMDSRKTSNDPVRDYIYKLSKDVLTLSNGFTEMMILTEINPQMPILLYSDNEEVVRIFDSGKMYNMADSNKKLSEYDPKNCINIKFEYTSNSSVPDKIEVIYHKD